MRFDYVKVNGNELEKCITDVGEIISMTNWGMGIREPTIYATFQTSEGGIESVIKIMAAVGLGVICLDENIFGAKFCSDPRVIMMFLWRYRQYCFNEPETDPLIPTREDAVEWLKEMDIPLEPQRHAKEPSPKTKRNFFNEKD